MDQHYCVAPNWLCGCPALTGQRGHGSSNVGPSVTLTPQPSLIKAAAGKAIHTF